MFATLISLVLAVNSTWSEPLIVPIRDELAQCEGSSKVTFLDQSVLLNKVGRQAECDRHYKEHKCEQFKASLNPEDRKNVISCQANGNGESSTSIRTLVVSCGDGIQTFVVDAVKGLVALPGAIGNLVGEIGRWYQRCGKDPTMRRALLAPVAMTYTSEEIEVMVREVSCEGLSLTVQNETKNFREQIAEKLLAQERYRKRGDGKAIPPSIALTPQEENFRKYQAALERNPNLFQMAWDEIAGRFQCYTPEAKSAAVCALVTGVVITGVAVKSFVAVRRSAIVSESFDKAKIALSRRLAGDNRLSSKSTSDEVPIASPPSSSVNLNPSLSESGTSVRDKLATNEGSPVSADTTDDLIRKAMFDPDFVPENKVKGSLEERDYRISSGATPDDVAKVATSMRLPPSNLSYSPLKPLSGRVVSKVENSLKEGKIVERSRIGVGDSQAMLVTLDGGIKGIWKPHLELDWRSNYRAEVLAYELDQKLGFNLVPPTVTRTVDGRIGSVQLYKDSAKGVKPLESELNKQSVFDYLIANGDRHRDNHLVTSSGRVVSIDHSISFTGMGEYAQSFAMRSPRIDAFLASAEGKVVLGNIRTFIDDPQNLRALQDYLGKKDADATIKRMEELLAYSGN